jgi:metallo-beta-lactamase family protein
MKLSFFGAAREVTGSCHYLEACGYKIFIDCGLPQGSDVELPTRFPVPAGEIDFVLLTHAHIDHAGRLPLLKKLGFRGKIYATVPTCDLSSIMLRDSAHIQESDAEWQNRKARRNGRPEIDPLYTMADAMAVIGDFSPCEYGQVITLAQGLKVRFRDIGHLLGSAAVEVWAEEAGQKRKLVFSGDIGNAGQPLLRRPEAIEDADYVVMEATYGDRCHSAPADYASELAAVIRRTFDRGGNVVIPAFAVGRTQEILYFLRIIKERGLVQGHGNFPVYLDSPLANEATTIYTRHNRDYFNKDALDLLNQGINPISFEGLNLSLTPDDSKAINFIKEPIVIISASGMCDAGRIRHHLKHNLWRKDSTIAFTGYQAHGTIGRALLEGASELRLFGEIVFVKSEIVRLTGISGHADQGQLIQWAKNFRRPLKRIFVVHGESTVCDVFAVLVKADTGCEANVPDYSGSWDLIADREIDAGIPLRPSVKKSKDRTHSPSYMRLLSIQQRLSSLVGSAKGWPNRDLTKLTDQLTSLCVKWER